MDVLRISVGRYETPDLHGRGKLASYSRMPGKAAGPKSDFANREARESTCCGGWGDGGLVGVKRTDAIGCGLARVAASAGERVEGQVGVGTRSVYAMGRGRASERFGSESVELDADLIYARSAGHELSGLTRCDRRHGLTSQ